MKSIDTDEHFLKQLQPLRRPADGEELYRQGVELSQTRFKLLRRERPVDVTLRNVVIRSHQDGQYKLLVKARVRLAGRGGDMRIYVDSPVGVRPVGWVHATPRGPFRRPPGL